MRKTVALLLVALALVAGSSARAADTDVLRTKIWYALSALVDAVASESPATPSHAERAALARTLEANLSTYAQRWEPRVLRAYPASTDYCRLDTLTGEKNCINDTPQSTIDGQVVAIFNNSVLLSVALAEIVPGDQLAKAKEAQRPAAEPARQ